MAPASPLDTDSNCLNYGCVMVHDGNDTDVYDFYDPGTGTTVLSGSALIYRAGNPYQGSGPVNMVFTDTLTPVTPTSLPGPGFGALLGIDQDNKEPAEVLVNDNNSDGYLDAADTLASYAIDESRTRVIFTSRELRHSFYVASNTPFDIYAIGTVLAQTGDLATSVSAQEIEVEVSATASGVDGGMSYGQDAVLRQFKTVKKLGDLTAGYTLISSFNLADGTHNTANTDTHVYEHSVRLDVLYTLPEFRMTMGMGDFLFQVQYNFFAQ